MSDTEQDLTPAAGVARKIKGGKVECPQYGVTGWTRCNNCKHGVATLWLSGESLEPDTVDCIYGLEQDNSRR